MKQSRAFLMHSSCCGLRVLRADPFFNQCSHWVTRAPNMTGHKSDRISSSSFHPSNSNTSRVFGCCRFLKRGFAKFLKEGSPDSSGGYWLDRKVALAKTVTDRSKSFWTEAYGYVLRCGQPDEESRQLGYSLLEFTHLILFWENHFSGKQKGWAFG